MCLLPRYNRCQQFAILLQISLSFFFFFFWLCWIFIAVCRLSLVSESGSYPSFQCMGFSLHWLLLSGSKALELWVGFSSCRVWTH